MKQDADQKIWSVKQCGDRRISRANLQKHAGNDKKENNQRYQHWENRPGQVKMAKILVVYDSRSGNTEKMASAIVDGARETKGVKAIVKKASRTNVEDLISADGIIMGSPTYYGVMSGKLKTLIDESVKIHGKLDGKVGAAFTSSGGVASGAETTLLSILQAMLVHGMIVQGRSEDKHYGAAAVGTAKEKDIASCRDLGRRVARLVMKLKE
jgi:NAD(P)H dehydrogenase (quinone)